MSAARSTVLPSREVCPASTGAPGFGKIDDVDVAAADEARAGREQRVAERRHRVELEDAVDDADEGWIQRIGRVEHDEAVVGVADIDVVAARREAGRALVVRDDVVVDRRDDGRCAGSVSE